MEYRISGFVRHFYGRIEVSIAPRGNCFEVFVAAEALSPEGFEVRELVNGISNVRFDYVVYAQRLGFEDAPTLELIGSLKDRIGLSRRLSGQQKNDLYALLPVEDSRVPAGVRAAFMRAVQEEGDAAAATAILENVVLGSVGILPSATLE